ncbi:hypothetical protein [Vibrio mediterranei]|uniref:hypothetical protein n=1 Tax=Vibrio mediterranei TaxID=689 RepID=UPI0040694564
MLNKKTGLAIASLPIVLSLAGCGDSSNAYFDQETRFWGKEVDFGKSRLFAIKDTKGTFFDENALEHFKMLESHAALEYGASTTEELERTSEIIANTRAALEYLPVPADLKAQYEANLAAAEAFLPKRVEVFEGKFNGKLDEAFRSIHPEYFTEIDAAQKVVDERSAFIAEAKNNYSQNKKNKTDARQAIRDLVQVHKEKATEWLVKHEIPISANALYLDPTYNGNYSTYDTEEACKAWTDEAHWNKEANICFTFYFPHNSRGLLPRNIEKLTAEQAKEFSSMVSGFVQESLKLAVKVSTAEKHEDESKEALNTREILATNRFGTERDINRKLSSAKQGLYSRTNGSYDRAGNIVNPGKGRYIRTQRKVWDEYTESLGLKDMPPATAFTAENAHKVYSALLANAEMNSVDIAIDKKGRFTVDDPSQTNVYIIANTKNGNRFGKVTWRMREDKYRADSSNLSHSDSLSEHYAKVRDWNIRFNNSGAEHRDLHSYINSL